MPWTTWALVGCQKMLLEDGWVGTKAAMMAPVSQTRMKPAKAKCPQKKKGLKRSIFLIAV